MATVFAVSLNMEATADGVGAAMGLAIPFAVFGQYAVTLTFTIMSGMMAKADKYAENADDKGIRNINFTEMAIPRYSVRSARCCRSVRWHSTW